VRPEQVTLNEVTLTWLASGNVVVSGDAFYSLGTFEAGGVIGAGENGVFRCTQPGLGSNGLRVAAMSTLTADPSATTSLAISLSDPVECVEGTIEAPPPALTPTVPVTTAEVHLVQTMGCEHTKPGEESELRKKGRITDSAGTPLQGIVVEETAVGPGLIDQQDYPVSSFKAYATTDANGEFTLVWRIEAYGPYTATVTALTTQDGGHLALDETSTTSVPYTVEATCTAP
jgi:hypothetical protein